LGPTGDGVVFLPLKDGPYFEVLIQWNPNRPISDHLSHLKKTIKALLV
jgi:hypothetical protein